MIDRAQLGRPAAAHTPLCVHKRPFSPYSDAHSVLCELFHTLCARVLCSSMSVSQPACAVCALTLPLPTAVFYFRVPRQADGASRHTVMSSSRVRFKSSHEEREQERKHRVERVKKYDGYKKISLRCSGKLKRACIIAPFY